MTTPYTLRLGKDRGFFDHGWLRTYHSFSFGDYFDRRFMGYRSLRVINEDFVEPGQGFGTHPHRDMEIITYILAGALEHRDSMGNGSIIHTGDVQYMSAGSGVTHSEFNPSDKEAVHLLQIWIRPSKMSAQPRYGQISIPEAERQNRWRLAVSPDGAQGSIAIRQNARLWVADVAAGETLEAPLAGPGWYLHCASGELSVPSADAVTLKDGDALATDVPPQIRAEAKATKALLLQLE